MLIVNISRSDVFGRSLRNGAGVMPGLTVCKDLNMFDDIFKNIFY